MISPFVAEAAGKQFHIRGGMLKGSYAATKIDANFSVIPSIDFEMEFFQSAKISTLVKANLTLDISKAKVFYSSIGAGQRYYFGGQGMLFDRIEGDYSFEGFSSSRYFLGWELGVAQALIQEYTATFSVVASVIELGILGGYSHQLSKNLALVVAAGGGYGMGFTTVSVSGLQMRGNLGLSFYF